MKRSPAAAFWLSLLPGVGHLYLGQFAKGLVIPLIVGGIINAVDQGADGLGILIPVFWLAVMLDAHRTAQEINVAIDRGMEPPRIDYRLGRWWGWVLIGLGVLFILVNFGVHLDWLFNLWPLALIALGLRVLRRREGEPIIGSSSDYGRYGSSPSPSASTSDPVPPPPQPNEVPDQGSSFDDEQVYESNDSNSEPDEFDADPFDDNANETRGDD